MLLKPELSPTACSNLSTITPFARLSQPPSPQSVIKLRLHLLIDEGNRLLALASDIVAPGSTRATSLSELSLQPVEIAPLTQRMATPHTLFLRETWFYKTVRL